MKCTLYYHIAGNFRRVQFSRMVELYCFTCLFFEDEYTHAHYVLYNCVYFAGLLFAVRQSFTKNCKNWTPWNFLAIQYIRVPLWAALSEYCSDYSHKVYASIGTPEHVSVCVCVCVCVCVRACVCACHWCIVYVHIHVCTSECWCTLASSWSTKFITLSHSSHLQVQRGQVLYMAHLCTCLYSS